MKSVACTSTSGMFAAGLPSWDILQSRPNSFCARGCSNLQDINQIIATVVNKVPDKQVMADLDATLRWVEDQGIVAAEKAGITGFCWGGRIVWLYAAHNPALKAGVA